MTAAERKRNILTDETEGWVQRFFILLIYLNPLKALNKGLTSDLTSILNGSLCWFMENQ